MESTCQPYIESATALSIARIHDYDNFVSADKIAIKHVTWVQPLCEVFNQKSLKTFQTAVHELLKLYLTTSVKIAFSEHNFSAVNRNTRNSSETSTLLHGTPYSSGALDLYSFAKEFAQVMRGGLHFFRHH